MTNPYDNPFDNRYDSGHGAQGGANPYGGYGAPYAGPQQGYGQPQPQYGYPQPGQQAYGVQPYVGAQPVQQYGPDGMPVSYGPPKSKAAAALLAFFLGWCGAHNFYLGHTGRAVAQLILFLLGSLTFIIIIGFFMLSALGLWVFIEFILILAGSNGYDRDARGVPVV